MKAFWSVSAVFLSVLVAYPQPEPTSADRAKELRMAANAILRENPHRVTTTIETRNTEESPWELYSSQTAEVAGPRRRHVIQHTGARREYIYIEDRTYSRIPAGPWLLLPDSYTGATGRSIGTPAVKNAIDERKDGEVVVDTRGHSKWQLLRTGEIIDTDSKIREWFDAGGRLTRIETESFDSLTKKFHRNTEVYEYDATIRVEAPIK